MLRKNNKAIGVVVALSLLMVVSVSSVVFFQNWYGSFSSMLFADAETNSGYSGKNDFSVVDSELYFFNGIERNITINGIKVSGNDCNVSNSIVTKKNNSKYDISDCVSNLSVSRNEVVIYTDIGVFSKYFVFDYVRSLGVTQTVIGNMTVSFTPSSSCDPGFSKIYSLDSTSNSHAEIPSSNLYTYSLCVDHDSYILSNSCSGNYVSLFYLGNTSNSHIYIDNSSAYDPGYSYYNWQQICLSSDSGTLDLTYNNTDMSGLGYSCLGSYIQDDVYGGVIGDCSGHTDKIWFKLE